MTETSQQQLRNVRGAQWCGHRVGGMVTIAPCAPGDFEIGVLVEDVWQGRGLGATLVHQAARLARARRADSITCIVHPDNTILLSTLRRAGLRARVRADDGHLVVSASVRDVDPMAVEHVGGVPRPRRRTW